MDSLLQCAAALQRALYEAALWSSADHALTQVRPRQIFTRTFSKNSRKCDHFGRSLEPCIEWTKHGSNDPAYSSHSMKRQMKK